MKLRKEWKEKNKNKPDHQDRSGTTLSHLIDPVTGEEWHGKLKKLFFKK